MDGVEGKKVSEYSLNNLSVPPRQHMTTYKVESQVDVRERANQALEFSGNVHFTDQCKIIKSAVDRKMFNKMSSYHKTVLSNYKKT